MIELPTPSAAASAHSSQLCMHIRRQLNDGHCSFGRYMEQALYAPTLGYYMAGAPKFGEGGDFVTAPERTPLFGECVATQCREVLDQVGGGILEFGAGGGHLAASVLSALNDQPDVPYAILEPSVELAERQRQYLEPWLRAGRDIRWLDALPAEHIGVILANEVLDAMPVERFVIGPDGVVQQINVRWQGEHFVDEPVVASVALLDVIEPMELHCGRLPVGYASEVSLLLGGWIGALSDMLSRGVALLIDYGYPRQEYYSPERHRGTLACYYRHRQHDNPYFYPGLQDITAHVDFTRVAEAALGYDLDLLGYTTQSAFLLSLDLLAAAEREQQAADGEVARLRVAQAVKALTLPGEMGERFQVMALGKGYDQPLRGLSAVDLCRRL